MSCYAHREDPARLVDLFNRTVRPVAGRCRLSTHLCFGNYKGRAVGPRRYAPMFPAFLELDVEELHLEMASRELAESELVAESAAGRAPPLVARPERLPRPVGQPAPPARPVPLRLPDPEVRGDRDAPRPHDAARRRPGAPSLRRRRDLEPRAHRPPRRGDPARYPSAGP